MRRSLAVTTTRAFSVSSASSLGETTLAQRVTIPSLENTGIIALTRHWRVVFTNISRCDGTIFFIFFLWFKLADSEALVRTKSRRRSSLITKHITSLKFGALSTSDGHINPNITEVETTECNDIHSYFYLNLDIVFCKNCKNHIQTKVQLKLVNEIFEEYFPHCWSTCE